MIFRVLHKILATLHLILTNEGDFELKDRTIAQSDSCRCQYLFETKGNAIAFDFRLLQQFKSVSTIENHIVLIEKTTKQISSAQQMQQTDLKKTKHSTNTHTKIF